MKFWKLFAICPFWQRNRKTASTAPRSNPRHEPAPPHGATSTPFHGAERIPPHGATLVPFHSDQPAPSHSTAPGPPRPSPALLQSCWEPENKNWPVLQLEAKKRILAIVQHRGFPKGSSAGYKYAEIAYERQGRVTPRHKKKDRSKAILFC